MEKTYKDLQKLRFQLLLDNMADREYRMSDESRKALEEEIAQLEEAYNDQSAEYGGGDYREQFDSFGEEE